MTTAGVADRPAGSSAGVPDFSALAEDEPPRIDRRSAEGAQELPAGAGAGAGTAKPSPATFGLCLFAACIFWSTGFRRCCRVAGLFSAVAGLSLGFCLGQID